MLPTQALTAGFELDAGSDAAQVAPRTENAGAAAARTSGAARQGFRIGDLRLMIPYEQGSELSDVSAIHRLSNAPDWFCGMANLHGKLTPVFDLARYFGVEYDRAAKRMLLVLGHGPDAAGVLVDGLPERLRLRDIEFNNPGPAPERLAPHLRGASQINGQHWIELDTESLLNAVEYSLGAAQ